MHAIFLCVVYMYTKRNDYYVKWSIKYGQFKAKDLFTPSFSIYEYFVTETSGHSVQSLE